MPDPHLNKWRILIIDDEASVTKLCRTILEQTGNFLVKEENDGSRAVGTARSLLPQLILLDYHLPGRTGPEIAAEIVTDPALKGIPIVFLTGDVDAAVAGGGYPVLLKPVRAADLIETCRAWVLPPDV